MTLLLDLTLRGGLVLVAVMACDTLWRGRVLASQRRWWWSLAPLSFLLPFRVALPVQWGSSLGGMVGGSVDWWRFPGSLGRWLEDAGFLRMCAWIWAAGAIIYLAMVAGRSWRALRELGQPRVSRDARLRAILDECRRALNLPIHVGLVVSTRVTAPAILGWFRPRIFLPERFVSSLSASQIRAAFLHELAHARTGDILCNYLWCLVSALHWFNPLVHLAFARWRVLQEEAADESAVRVLGEFPPRAYSDLLLQVLRGADSGAWSVGAVGMGDSYRGLKQRFTALKTIGRTRSSTTWSVIVVLVLTAMTLAQPSRSNVPSGAGGCPMGGWVERHLYVVHLR